MRRFKCRDDMDDDDVLRKMQYIVFLYSGLGDYMGVKFNHPFLGRNYVLTLSIFGGILALLRFF